MECPSDARLLKNTVLRYRCLVATRTHTTQYLAAVMLGKALPSKQWSLRLKTQRFVPFFWHVLIDNQGPQGWG